MLLCRRSKCFSSTRTPLPSACPSHCTCTEAGPQASPRPGSSLPTSSRQARSTSTPKPLWWACLAKLLGPAAGRLGTCTSSRYTRMTSLTSGKEPHCPAVDELEESPAGVQNDMMQKSVMFVCVRIRSMCMELDDVMYMLLSCRWPVHDSCLPWYEPRTMVHLHVMTDCYVYGFVLGLQGRVASCMSSTMTPI